MDRLFLKSIDLLRYSTGWTTLSGSCQPRSGEELDGKGQWNEATLYFNWNSGTSRFLPWGQRIPKCVISLFQVQLLITDFMDTGINLESWLLFSSSPALMPCNRTKYTQNIFELLWHHTSIRRLSFFIFIFLDTYRFITFNILFSPKFYSCLVFSHLHFRKCQDKLLGVLAM